MLFGSLYTQVVRSNLANILGTACQHVLKYESSYPVWYLYKLEKQQVPVTLLPDK